MYFLHRFYLENASFQSFISFLLKLAIVPVISNQNSQLYVFVNLTILTSHCLTSGKTYTECLRYADCDFMTLAVRYSLPDFTFSCCQKTLCNGEEKTFLQKLKDFFG